MLAVALQEAVGVMTVVVMAMAAEVAVVVVALVLGVTQSVLLK